MIETRVVKIIDTHINPKLQEHRGWIELADLRMVSYLYGSGARVQAAEAYKRLWISL